MPSFAAPALTGFAVAVLARRGVPAADAQLTAACLIDANLSGIDSHGIRLLTAYAHRLDTGAINPTPRLSVLHETPATVAVDGDDGLGPVVGAYAMDRAIAKAKEVGTGIAVARRSHHFGAAAWFAERAVDAGLIGVAATNGSAALAPYGGAAPMFGANPLAVAIPAQSSPSIVLDMSTSVSSRARIRRLVAGGEAIPEGWAIDAEGRPTTDAAAAIAGALLPFAGPKGSGLALILEVLAGALAGAGFSFENGDLYGDRNRPQGLGHFLLVIDPAAFGPEADFAGRVECLIQALHDVPPVAGGDGVRLPGEHRPDLRRERRAHGIALPDREVAELAALGERFNLQFPAAVDRSYGGTQ